MSTKAFTSFVTAHSDNYDDDEPLWFSPLHNPKDVLCAGSDSEDSPAEIAAKRKRYEECGQRYMRGQMLVLQSASLKGPLEGWANPWRYRPHEKTHRRRPEQENITKGMRTCHEPEGTREHTQDTNRTNTNRSNRRRGDGMSPESHQSPEAEESMMHEEDIDVSTITIESMPLGNTIVSTKRPIDRSWLKGSYISKRAKWDAPCHSSPTPIEPKIPKPRFRPEHLNSTRPTRLSQTFDNEATLDGVEGNELKPPTNLEILQRVYSKGQSSHLNPSTISQQGNMHQDLDLGVYNNSMDTSLGSDLEAIHRQPSEFADTTLSMDVNELPNQYDTPSDYRQRLDALTFPKLESSGLPHPRLRAIDSATACDSVGHDSFITDIAPSSRDLEQFQFRKKKRKKKHRVESIKDQIGSSVSKGKAHKSSSTGNLSDEHSWSLRKSPSKVNTDTIHSKDGNPEEKVHSLSKSRDFDDSWTAVDGPSVHSMASDNPMHKNIRSERVSRLSFNPNFDSLSSMSFSDQSPKNSHLRSSPQARQPSQLHRENEHPTPAQRFLGDSTPVHQMRIKPSPPQAKYTIQSQRAIRAPTTSQQMPQSPAAVQHLRERSTSSQPLNGSISHPLPSSRKKPHKLMDNGEKSAAHHSNATDMDGSTQSYNTTPYSSAKFQLQLDSQSPLKFEALDALFIANDWSRRPQNDLDIPIHQEIQQENHQHILRSEKVIEHDQKSGRVDNDNSLSGPAQTMERDEATAMVEDDDQDELECQAQLLAEEQKQDIQHSKARTNLVPLISPTKAGLVISPAKIKMEKTEVCEDTESSCSEVDSEKVLASRTRRYQEEGNSSDANPEKPQPTELEFQTALDSETPVLSASQQGNSVENHEDGDMPEPAIDRESSPASSHGNSGSDINSEAVSQILSAGQPMKALETSIDATAEATLDEEPDLTQSSWRDPRPQSPWTAVEIRPTREEPNRSMLVEESFYSDKDESSGWQTIERPITPDDGGIRLFRDLLSPTPPLDCSPVIHNGLPSTQVLVDAATSNPWTGKLETPKTMNSGKRVSFGELSQGEMQSDGPGFSRSGVRRCSPPPPSSIEYSNDDQTFNNSVTSIHGFKNHFAIASAYKPTLSKTSNLLPQGSPAVSAMAEAFVAADNRTSSGKQQFSLRDRRRSWRQEHHSASKFNVPLEDIDLGKTDLSNSGERRDSTLTEKSSNINAEEALDDFLGGAEAFLEDWSVEAELKKAKEADIAQSNAAKRRKLFGLENGW